MTHSDQTKTIVLITAGGNGTRLWPLSTTAVPKQFARLLGSIPSFQSTYELAASYFDYADIYVAVQERQRRLVLEQARGICPRNIIAEPFLHDTLASTIHAMDQIRRVTRSDKTVVIILAADQIISNGDALRTAFRKTVLAAQIANNFVSIGVTPSHPSTQYGYMRCGESFTGANGVFRGEEYIEKPALDVAMKLISDKNYIWNTNIFGWRIDSFFSAIEHFLPSDYSVFRKIASLTSEDLETDFANLYGSFTRLSIDHALLEKIGPRSPFSHVFVHADFSWCDIGSFKSLADHLIEDLNCNRIAGKVKTENTHSCILISDGEYDLVTSDVQDCLIVVSGENLLIASRRSENELRKLFLRPLNTNLKSNDQSFEPHDFYEGNNRVNAFVRLHNVENCLFNSDRDGIICASDVSGLQVRRQGRTVSVNKSSPSSAFSNRLTATTLPKINFTIYADVETLSATIAEQICTDIKNIVAEKGEANVSFSAGETFSSIYRVMATRYKNSVNWERVNFFQMDEYLNLSTDDEKSLASYLKNHLIERLGIKRSFFIHDSQGMLARDLKAYDLLIESCGGLDLIAHGIGENGHLAFNEPGSEIDSVTRFVNLTPSTLSANSRNFEDIALVPTRAVTIGLAQIRAARKSYLVGIGPRKAAAINSLLFGPITTALPASILRIQDNVTFAIDQKACNWILSDETRCDN